MSMILDTVEKSRPIGVDARVPDPGGVIVGLSVLGWPSEV